MPDPNQETILSNEKMLADADAMVVTLKTRMAEIEPLFSRFSDLLTAAETRTAEINSIATAALAAKTQITDEQAVIATKSSHIQDAQIHADKVRAELDRLQTTATQQATEAEGQRQRAQTASDAANELLTGIRAHKATAEVDAAAAAMSHDTAKTAAGVTKNLADKAKTIEEQVAAYEKRLAQLELQCKAQLETITGLLPGATTTGLAYAFDDRRKTFLKPGSRWQWLFIGSVTLIVLLALSGLGHIYLTGVTPTWDELVRIWLARLPIAGALVWLAIHASRESALAKRLEEDYGYKAAIAASFQGFQKQMTEIGSNAPESSPLSKLCSDTLATISTPPGRIYEKHKLIVTPTGEIANAAKEVIGRK